MAAGTREFEWLNDAEQKGIMGSMDASGVVSFVIVAGADSSVRGTTYFNAMLDWFGDNATAIHCMWVKGAPDRVSTNIDKVNELTGRGVPLAEAIQQAWTVTRAVKRGFIQARVAEQPLGSPGCYSRIEVILEK